MISAALYLPLSDSTYVATEQHADIKRIRPGYNRRRIPQAELDQARRSP